MVDDGGDDEKVDSLGLFDVPADYYVPTRNPTTETYTLRNKKMLTLHLVGHNPLWGHHLWNGGRQIAQYLEENPFLVKDKTVLELGAGAGLPGLVAACLDARKVVITDYPDIDLVQNISKNIEAAGFDGSDEFEDGKRVAAAGYCWGADVDPILHTTRPCRRLFDLLILADLLFNHSEHDKLIRTVQLTLGKWPGTQALVFFTPYRPWLLEKDLAFFKAAEVAGFNVQKVLEIKHEKVMFENDPGDEELRRTVFGYILTWKTEAQG